MNDIVFYQYDAAIISLFVIPACSKSFFDSGRIPDALRLRE